jgi:hypothetical protein
MISEISGAIANDVDVVASQLQDKILVAGWTETTLQTRSFGSDHIWHLSNFRP